MEEQKEEHRLVKERIKKFDELKEAGVDPFPYSYRQTHHSKEIKEKYGASLKATEHTNDKVIVAGRIMTIREMGKASFFKLQDQSGQIQVYIKQEDVGEGMYKIFRKLDIGDIIGVEGFIFKTKTGELTIATQNIQLLCKSFKPLPEKYHGLKDTELRYRQRYLDLIMNQDVKDRFVLRSKIIQAYREFMLSKGFIEVDTPTLQTVYGGAAARPFVTHINAWKMDMFLNISPELHLKRLIVGGFEKVFTICKNFRNEDADKTHNPEFTMSEFYQAYADYNDMMKLTEEVFEYVAKKVLGTTVIEYEGKKIDLKSPWPRVTVYQALKKFAGLDVEKMDDGQIQEQLLHHNLVVEGGYNRGKAIIELFQHLCEPHLIQPTFIIDYPKEASPLCKKKRGNQELIEKVEPYINGWEMGNGYSELNDPFLQEKLLKEQAAQLRAGFEEAQPFDEDFVNALKYGLPPTGGMGIGIDRMIILLTNAASIRDAILFPTMKPMEEKEEKKE
ncbi:MAG: lysine--tRNA ligase [Candidatus Woesearchaeota archaeon]